MVSMSSSEKVTVEKVIVRRSPRFIRFMVVGIILGVLAALILTFAFPNTSEFSLTQIFGFMLLITGTVGGTLGLVFALVFDKLYSQRTGEATAEHVVIENPTEESEQS